MHRSYLLFLFWLLSLSLYAHKPAQKYAAGMFAGFEENKGQMADYNGTVLSNVLFKAQQPGITTYITNNGLSYFMFTVSEFEKKENGIEVESQRTKWKRIDMQLKGAFISTKNLIVENALPHSANYYLTHCPNGILNVKSYKKITFKNIYPKIDWVVYTNTETGASFKYDFIINPGGDPNDIQITYEGAGNFDLNSLSQTITLKNNYGKITEGSLECFQEDNRIASSYNIINKRNHLIPNHFKYNLCFNISTYDKNKTLVIDPPVQQYQWGTFFGGNSLDGINDIKINTTNDHVYITGYTNSTLNFPLNSGGGTFYQGTTPDGGGDSYIARFDQNDALQWCTYFGGVGIDAAYALAIAPDNSIYVTGAANGGMPVVSGGSGYIDLTNNGQDAYVFRFSQAGARMWGTYFGGGPNQDWGKDITVDKNGNVIVVGISGSFNGFPTMNAGGYFNSTFAGVFDMFIARFDATYNLNWSTLYGGAASNGAESVLTDAAGNIYVGGWSSAADMNTQPLSGAYNNGTYSGGIYNGAQGQGDAVLLKFDNNTNLQWATFYGGTDNDAIIDMAFSPSGSLYATGWTNSSNFPTVNEAGAFNQPTYGGGNGGIGAAMGGDAFVLKFSNSLSLQWATYFGGAGDEIQTQSSYGDGTPAIICDAAGNTYIAGISCLQGTIPTADPGNGALYRGTFSGTSDIYLAQFNNKDSLFWSTYIGGNISSSAGDNDFGRSLALNSQSCLYLAGEWWSLNPPSKSQTGSYNQSSNGSDESCIMKFCPNLTPLSLTTTSTNATCNSVATGSVTANPSGGTPNYTYSWNPGNYTNANVTGLAAGIYTVTITDQNGTSTTATAEVTEPTAIITNVVPLNAKCFNTNTGSAGIVVSGGTTSYTYSWSGTTQTSSNVTGLAQGSYTVKITDKNGCTKTNAFSISEPAQLVATVNSTGTACAVSNGSANANITGGTTNFTYAWTGTTQTNGNITGLAAGGYTLTVHDANNCSATASFTITNPNAPTASISTFKDASCKNANDGNATATASGGSTNYTYSWNNTTQTTATATGLTQGIYTVTVTDANSCKATVSITISEPTAILVTGASTASNCGQNTGTATATVSGGTTGYTYTWNDALTQTTMTASNLAAGQYTVIVSDKNNCTATTTVKITTPNGPQTYAMFSIVSCAGDSGWAQVDVLNPGTSTYSYSWQGGQTTGYVSGLPSGTYSVTITNNSTLCKTDTTVTIPSNPPINVSFNSNPTTCAAADGAATATASGGVGTASQFTYSWSTTATTANISNLISGIYTVTVKDNVGCTKTATVLISSITMSAPGSVSADTTILKGESVQLLAGGGVSYIWSPNTFLSCGNCDNPIATPTHTQQYIVIITDPKGCTDQDTVTVYIDIDCNGELFLPTAFSPNKDGVNDIFIVRGNCIKEFTLNIFNRWGEKVFETTDPKIGWDGTYNNTELNSGVFVYYVSYRSNLNNTIVSKKGNVTLVR